MTQSNSTTTLIQASIAIICGVIVFWLYNSQINPTVSRIIITGVFPQNTSISVNSISARNNTTRQVEVITTKSGSNPQRVGTDNINTPIQKLELVFKATQPSTIEALDSEHSKQIVLHNIQIQRAYLADIFIGDQRILENFNVQNSVNSNSDHLFIANAQNAVSLSSKSNLSSALSWKGFILSLIFTAGLYLIIRQFCWRDIPAFSDMTLGREISSSHEFLTINGLRGLAAILVLLSHTAPGFFGLGIGLAMLLVLSGFLLSKPFILAPDKILKRENILGFLSKRLKRILPMYYLYIFISYVVTLKLDLALRHFLFVQAEGHLWPMPQILAFYMLLPFILIITSYLFKLNKIAPILFLLISAYLWLSEMSEWQPFYNGEFTRAFLLYAFLIGVAGAYVQYGLVINNQKVTDFLVKRAGVLSIAGIIITALTIGWSAPIKAPELIQQPISLFHIKCLLCIIIILLALNTKDALFAKLISNKVFCAVGIVGFSFYILHGLGMQIVLQAQKQLLMIPNPVDRSWLFTLAVSGVTYLLSVVTYSYIERPFFGFRKSAINKNKYKT